MGYWQDLLAENPTLINASLNTTGPFRWFLYDALCDNKPLDRMVTELILLRGSQHEGGSAGFGIAANNDAPFAAKGQVVASAFRDRTAVRVVTIRLFTAQNNGICTHWQRCSSRNLSPCLSPAVCRTLSSQSNTAHR
ncbi:MAG: hypothetical protein WKF77_04355 [Planctomycetaceae bacterium]